jgi:hypothetical protein
VMVERVGQPKSCFGTNQGNNQFYSLFEQKLLNRPSLQSGSTTELRQSLKQLHQFKSHRTSGKLYV